MTPTELEALLSEVEYVATCLDGGNPRSSDCIRMAIQTIRDQQAEITAHMAFIAKQRADKKQQQAEIERLREELEDSNLELTAWQKGQLSHDR